MRRQDEIAALVAIVERRFDWVVLSVQIKAVRRLVELNAWNALEQIAKAKLN